MFRNLLHKGMILKTITEETLGMSLHKLIFDHLLLQQKQKKSCLRYHVSHNRLQRKSNKKKLS